MTTHDALIEAQRVIIITTIIIIIINNLTRAQFRVRYL